MENKYKYKNYADSILLCFIALLLNVVSLPIDAFEVSFNFSSIGQIVVLIIVIAKLSKIDIKYKKYLPITIIMILLLVISNIGFFIIFNFHGFFENMEKVFKYFNSLSIGISLVIAIQALVGSMLYLLVGSLIKKIIIDCNLETRIKKDINVKMIILLVVQIVLSIIVILALNFLINEEELFIDFMNSIKIESVLDVLGWGTLFVGPIGVLCLLFMVFYILFLIDIYKVRNLVNELSTKESKKDDLKEEVLTCDVKYEDEKE